MRKFIKHETNVYTTEVIECPDCCFTFSTEHDLEGNAGVYTCPNCSEIRLENENEDMRDALKEIIDIAEPHAEFTVAYERICKIARKALGVNENE